MLRWNYRGVIAVALTICYRKGNTSGLTQKFNYDEFVRGFRAACERRGVDPARGATGYQVVNAVVDRRRAVRKWSRLPQRHWWQNPDLWLNCPPYRSETEQQAV